MISLHSGYMRTTQMENHRLHNKLNKVNWRGIAELVGISSIILGLVFVGIQLKQDQRIAEAQLGAEESARSAAVAQLMTDNIDIWVRGMDGEELSHVEEVTFRVVASAVHEWFTDEYHRGYRLGGLARPPAGIAQNYAYFIYSSPGYRRIFWDQRLKRLAARNSTFDRAAFVPENIDAQNFIAAVSEALEDLDGRGVPASDPRSYTE